MEAKKQGLQSYHCQSPIQFLVWFGFEMGSHYAAQAGLELLGSSQPLVSASRMWNFRHTSPYLASNKTQTGVPRVFLS
jgi:hypothetical protein